MFKNIGMVEKPVKDKDPVMGSTFTGHVWKRAWMTSVITSWRAFCLPEILNPVKYDQ